MQVNFDATLEELVDVMIRSTKQTGSFRAQRRTTTIIGAVFGVMIMLAVFSFVDVSWILKISVALIAGIAATVWSWFAFPGTFEKGIRKYAQKETNGRASFAVQVDVDPSGISFTQLGNRTTHDWRTVGQIQPVADGVQVQFKNGSLGMVRARAFESPEHQKEFSELGNAYLDANREGIG